MPTPLSFNPFHVIETNFHAPFSGDVSQRIAPRVFSPGIAGDVETEWRIHRNVASYGKQLGKLLEAVEAIAERMDEKSGVQDCEEIQEIIALRKSVDAEKESHRESLKRKAVEALEA